MTKLSNGTTQAVSSTTIENGLSSGIAGGTYQQAFKEVTNAGVGNNVAKAIDNKMGKCLPANPHC